MPRKEDFAHIYLFTSPQNWDAVLQANPSVSGSYRLKLARMRLTSFLAEPLRHYEQARYQQAILQTPLHPQPVFIMGLWRSGTTHLHNLMALDPNYGYATTLQCMAPHFVVSQAALMRRALTGLLPHHRVFDNMSVDLDGPQEEELALATISPHSYYTYWFFPSQTLPLFEKYMRLRGLSPQQWEEWRQAYLFILKQSTYLQGGNKPLLLKSPTNLTRTRALLEIFPQAKFIEILRNPLRIWLSLLNMQKVVLPMHALEGYRWEEIVEAKRHVFVTAMQQWLEEKKRIPPENLVSVRYEDLVSQPVSTLEHIYEALGLSPEQARPRWQPYLQSLQGYQTNRFTASPADLAFARQNFGFLYEAGQYALE